LTHGTSEETILKQAKMGGQPIPDFIKNKPELDVGLDVYLQAYFDLYSERTHSFGPAGIPTTSMLLYASAFNFDDEQTDDLVYFLRKMDAENLKRVGKLQKKPGDK
jgi:hypothetical protein